MKKTHLKVDGHGIDLNKDNCWICNSLHIVGDDDIFDINIHEIIWVNMHFT